MSIHPKIFFRVALLALACGLSPFASTAQEQRERVIQRIALPNEPVEVLEVEVGGRAVKLNSVFTAGRDWLKGLKLKMKNVSEQPIVFAEIMIKIPKSGTMEHPLGIPVRYGQLPPPPGEAVSTSAPKPVSHGKVIELVLSDKTFNTAKSFLSEHQVMEVGEVKMFGLMIIFDDGTGWNEGVRLRRDPSNPRKWKSTGREESLRQPDVFFRNISYIRPPKYNSRRAATDDVRWLCYSYFQFEHELCGTELGNNACTALNESPRIREYDDFPPDQKKLLEIMTVICEGIDCSSKTKTVTRSQYDFRCGYSGGNEWQ